jgi:hypothetical protein
MPERNLIPGPEGRQNEDRGLARRIQCGVAAQQPRVSEAGGICEKLLRAHQQDGRHLTGRFRFPDLLQSAFTPRQLFRRFIAAFAFAILAVFFLVGLLCPPQ